MIRHLVLMILVVLIAAPHPGEADVGPKPHFEIFFDQTIGQDDRPELLTCQKNTCEDQLQFKEVGPQRFDCDSPQVKEKHSCYVLAYGFSPYLKLRIHTKDKVYESEPFTPGGDVNVTLKNGQLALSKGVMSKLGCWWWCW